MAEPAVSIQPVTAERVTAPATPASRTARRSVRTWATRDAELLDLLTDVRVLVVDTGRVWWRLLPQLTTVYLLGWLGSQLALRLAVFAGEVSAWLALVLFSFSFVSVLASLVVMLQLAGRELGVQALIPTEEAVSDGRDESISRLLAVTLLPFLGIYAAFGLVADAANTLTVEQGVRDGYGAPDSVLGVLYQVSQHHPWRLLGLVVGVYLLRRGLDLLHERTERGVLGLAAVFVESFFTLLLLLGAIRLVERALIWFRDRAFWGWLAQLRDAAAAFLSRFEINLPAVLHQLASFLTDQVWPVLWEVVSQPIIWLAVAALVYGSQVLSLAELWRKGQSYADRVPGAGVFSRRRDKRAVRPAGAPRRRVVRAAGEAKEAFFGDIDDKYLPTFHSLRLILRAGVVFLGSFVLVYGLLQAVTDYGDTAVTRLVGGHPVDFWTTWSPWVDLAQTLPFEPLRLCLLAVAFRRSLELFRRRSLPAAVGVAG